MNCVEVILFFHFFYEIWVGEARASNPHPGGYKMIVSGAHHIGQVIYHLEWCPKYRYEMFISAALKKGKLI